MSFLLFSDGIVVLFGRFSRLSLQFGMFPPSPAAYPCPVSPVRVDSTQLSEISCPPSLVGSLIT